MKRKTEVYRNNQWVECRTEDLRVGESFRMWEDDQPVIGYDGVTKEYIVYSKPEQVHGVWQVVADLQK